MNNSIQNLAFACIYSIGAAFMFSLWQDSYPAGIFMGAALQAIIYAIRQNNKE